MHKKCAIVVLAAILSLFHMKQSDAQGLETQPGMTMSLLDRVYQGTYIGGRVAPGDYKPQMNIWAGFMLSRIAGGGLFARWDYFNLYGHDSQGLQLMYIEDTWIPHVDIWISFGLASNLQYTRKLIAIDENVTGMVEDYETAPILGFGLNSNMGSRTGMYIGVQALDTFDGNPSTLGEDKDDPRFDKNKPFDDFFVGFGVWWRPFSVLLDINEVVGRR